MPAVAVQVDDDDGGLFKSSLMVSIAWSVPIRPGTSKDTHRQTDRRDTCTCIVTKENDIQALDGRYSQIQLH